MSPPPAVALLPVGFAGAQALPPARAACLRALQALGAPAAGGVAEASARAAVDDQTLCCWLCSYAQADLAAVASGGGGQDLCLLCNADSRLLPLALLRQRAREALQNMPLAELSDNLDETAAALEQIFARHFGGGAASGQNDGDNNAAALRARQLYAAINASKASGQEAKQETAELLRLCERLTPAQTQALGLEAFVKVGKAKKDLEELL